MDDTSIRSSRGHSWSATQGQLGAPDGHACIVLTDDALLAMPGDWAWQVGAKTANGAAFTVAVSLFFGEPPPLECAALPPSG